MPKHIFLPMLTLILILTACESTSTFVPPSTPTSSVPGLTETSVYPGPTPISTTTPTSTSGIIGNVTEGPMCPGPVPIGNNPCPDQPYQATFTILNAGNVQVAQIQSDANGYFKIELPPGTYTLHPLMTSIYPRAGDLTVVFNPGEYIQVTIQFDTGMR